MSTITYTVASPDGDVPVTVTERGTGRPVLLLHGGAGPDSVAGFAELLAARFPVRVLTPVHPGFGGTQRPGSLGSVPDLAGVYARLLDQLGLTGVIVAGSSIGGWIAAELTLAAPSRVGALLLIDAVGIDSPAHPVADFFALTPDEVAALSWAHPEGHSIDVASMTEAQRAIFAGNRATLLAYAGQAMGDPSLNSRLGAVTVPALVVWGEADRIVTPDYGKEYAAAIPGASFRVVPDAGHLPQLEAPEATLGAVGSLVGGA